MKKTIQPILLFLSMSFATNVFTVDHMEIINKTGKVINIGTCLLGGLVIGCETLATLDELKDMVCRTGAYDNERVLIDEEPSLAKKSAYGLASWVYGFITYTMIKNMITGIRDFNS